MTAQPPDGCGHVCAGPGKVDEVVRSLLVKCYRETEVTLVPGWGSMYQFQGKAAFNVVDMNSGKSISQEISEFQRTLLVLCAFANLFVLILAIVCERPPPPPGHF